MVITLPSVVTQITQGALDKKIRHIWFHRSFVVGSASPEALPLCRFRVVGSIEGRCPLMYCQPIDAAHLVFRWWLRLKRRVPY